MYHQQYLRMLVSNGEVLGKNICLPEMVGLYWAVTKINLS